MLIALKQKPALNCYAATETDHCRAYTLSHPGDQDYAIHCDHNPDDRCDRCSQLASVGGDIEEVLETAQCSVETKDELVFLKFRKSQTDWFGKRGIPWHIAVTIRRGVEGQMEIMTFVHLFDSCNQDSSSVLVILSMFSVN